MALVEAVHDDNTYPYPARECARGTDSGGVLFNKHQLKRRHCAVKVHEQEELTRTLSRIRYSLAVCTVVDSRHGFEPLPSQRTRRPTAGFLTHCESLEMPHALGPVHVG